MAKKVTKKPATKKKTTARKPRRTTTKKTEAPLTAASTPEMNENAVRLRAFQIYTSGRNSGNPDADWLQAEHELRAAS